VNRAVVSSENARWGTPLPEFAPLDALFRFTIDVAAERWSAKCPRYFTKKDDALSKSWKGEVWFLNPEFGRRIGWWVDKARREAVRGSQGLLVLPSRVDTEWWKHYVRQRDGFAGQLRASSYDPMGDVHWYRWDRLIVGVRDEDHRWKFDLPPGSDAAEEAAPFPTSLVIFSSPLLAPPKGWRTSDLLAGWPR
jgi:hypothetical protein